MPKKAAHPAHAVAREPTLDQFCNLMAFDTQQRRYLFESKDLW